ncbi:calcium/sodium antiporter [Candidatus Woesearchaeota archaeon]|nr:calcium/sodium antiporter [Candidatus Woesearchaeota archaeon]
MIELLIFVAGLFFLVMGAEYFVKSTVSVAKKLGVSGFVIGLTFVALGTSIPELASSIVAAIQNHPGIVIGNVVGSNIANIGLIIGVAATVRTLRTKEVMLKRDGYIMIFVTLLFYVFIYNGLLSWIEALFLLIVYVAYVVFLLHMKPELRSEYRFPDFLKYFFKFGYIMTIRSQIIEGLNSRKNNKAAKKKKDARKKAEIKVSPEEKKEIKSLFKVGIAKDLLIALVSMVAIVFGAEFVVKEAVFFAQLLSIPESFIAISVIAIGTSLPELSVALSAAKKGYGNVAVGGIIGSNIANILLIIGVSGLINPLSVIRQTVIFTAPVMLLFSVMLLVFIKSYWSIKRSEGIALLVMYVLFIMLLFLGFI